MTNKVFIATSLDGYIADKNGNIEWLHSIPNPEGIDMGYAQLMDSVDALVMGRNTFEVVCSFDIPWPYEKPVFVLSSSLQAIPKDYEGKAFLINGTLQSVMEKLHQQGYNHLYIDGGKTIQNFLKEDLIDEMIITLIPILLGGGIPLFSDLATPMNFSCVSTEIFLDKVVQNKFVRDR